MIDPVRALRELPLARPEARELVIEELLAANGDEIVAIAEDAILAPPEPPPGAAADAYLAALESLAVHLLGRAGGAGLDALLRLSEARVEEGRPSVIIATELGFIATERPAERARACDALLRALSSLDPAELVVSPNLPGVLTAAAEDARLERFLDGLVRERPDLGVHLLVAWARTSGRAPTARHEDTLRSIVRRGLVSIAKGTFVVFAVGMRTSEDDPPVHGELLAAELLLALDRTDPEVLAWLARQATAHPDPALASYAARLLDAASGVHD